MKQCPYCGAQVNDDCLFCTECGRPIPQGDVCPHCGASVNESDVFCQSCGKRVDEKPSMDVSDTTQKKCPYCGASVNDGDVFCENCGRNLADGSIGFATNEVRQENYVEEDSSSNNMKVIIPIIIGVLLLLALIGGGWWYWKTGPSITSNKEMKPTLDTDSVEEMITSANDSIEEVVDSLVFIDSVADTVYSPGIEGEYGEMVEEETDANETTNKSEDSNEIHDVVDQMPQFPGGQSALLEYLAKNVNYPVAAEENGIHGKVIVTFVVERDGSITNAKVVKSLDPSLDKEALRVVNSMPLWQPGKQNGIVVRVKYTVSVQFRLN